MHVLLGIDMCINKYNHIYIYVHDIYVHILVETPATPLTCCRPFEGS